jgi:enoyl-[acyl-carrier-protein] reductase (NADH)
MRPLAHSGCLGRLVVLSDVGVAAFLASEHARNIAGSVLHIDAG